MTIGKTLDAVSAATSGTAALASMLVQHLSLVVLGVDLSTVLIGFSGVMLAVSLVPKEETRWWKAILTTFGYLMASVVLPTLVIDISHLQKADGKAVTFLVGFGFPVLVWFVHMNRPRLERAFFSWIERTRGSKGLDDDF